MANLGNQTSNFSAGAANAQTANYYAPSFPALARPDDTGGPYGDQSPITTVTVAGVTQGGGVSLYED